MIKIGNFVTVIHSEFAPPIFGKVVATDNDKILVKIFGELYWFSMDEVRII